MRNNAETQLVRSLLLAASAQGVTLFRNNVGVLQDRAGHYVTYGLAVGSPDLVGFMPLTITPRMVGKKISVFVGVECKTNTGRISEPQRAFLAAIEKSGAISGVVRSVGDFDSLISLWRESI